MASEQIQNQIRTAIQAAQSGNKGIARYILEEVLKEAPDTELAWLWLASVVDTVPERRNALEKVLAINPNNERAQQALATLPAAEEMESATGEETPATTDQPDTEVPQVAERHAASPPLRRPVSRPERPSISTRTTPVPGGDIPEPGSAPLSGEPAVQRVPPEQQSRRGLPRVMFVVLVFLAIGMIGLGIYLLLEESQSDDTSPTETPQGAAIVPTEPPIGFAPTATPTWTPRPPETMPPTWTPSITPTHTATPTPTATLLPLDTYTLLVSGKRDGGTRWQLYTMQADGSQQDMLSFTLSEADQETELTLLELFDAAYSPDGSQVAGTVRLQRGTTEFEDVFVAPAEGGEIRLLNTVEADNVESVTWSGDGEQLAFASDADGDFDVYIMPADGGEIRMLTNNDVQDRDPAWSPVDDLLVYSSDQASPGELEIWRINIYGQNMIRLTSAQNSSFSPAWSADGTMIVFLSDRRQRTDVYTMTAEGSGERALIVRDVPREERDPAWSADGKWISFSSNRQGPIFDLYIIRPDGTDLQRVTETSGDTRFAVWLPQE